MKLRRIAALSMVGIMALLSACGSSGSSAGGSASETGAADVSQTSAAESAGGESEAAGTQTTKDGLTELDIVLDWYPNAIHTFLYEAIENGYFEDEGLSVNLISPAQSVDAITFVASGKAQLGLTYPVEIAQAVDKDMPVRALASVCQKQLDCMCSLKSNTDITSDMTSLKGKKVGYSGTSVAEATVRTITRNAGLKDDDYDLIDVGFDLVTSLTTGSVDMVAGTFINDEVVTMEQSGYDLNVYEEADYGFPELFGLVMAVNEDDYNAHPDTYAAFLRACQKGFDDMSSDESAALNLIMTKMSSDDNPLDETQQTKSYEILMTKMATDDQPFLTMGTNKWQAILDWMKTSDLTTKQLSTSDVTIGPEVVDDAGTAAAESESES